MPDDLYLQTGDLHEPCKPSIESEMHIFVSVACRAPIELIVMRSVQQSGESFAWVANYRRRSSMLVMCVCGL